MVVTLYWPATAEAARKSKEADFKKDIIDGKRGCRTILAEKCDGGHRKLYVIGMQPFDRW